MTTRPNQAPSEPPNPCKIERKTYAKIDAETVYETSYASEYLTPVIFLQCTLKSLEKDQDPQWARTGFKMSQRLGSQITRQGEGGKAKGARTGFKISQPLASQITRRGGEGKERTQDRVLGVLRLGARSPEEGGVGEAIESPSRPSPRG